MGRLRRVHATNLSARTLAATLAVATLWTTSPAHGDPADIFSVGAPAIGSAPPKASDIRSGDASVSATGALQFSYPIVVPPGRNGMQPSIALSYSSQGWRQRTVSNRGSSLTPKEVPMLRADATGPVAKARAQVNRRQAKPRRPRFYFMSLDTLTTTSTVLVANPRTRRSCMRTCSAIRRASRAGTAITATSMEIPFPWTSDNEGRVHLDLCES